MAIHSVDGWYGAGVGSRFRYRCVADSSLSIRRIGGAEVDHQVANVRGSLEVLVVARRAREMVLQVSFPGMRLEAGAADRARAISTALAQPVLVLASASGNTLGYRFPSDMSAECCRWVRTLVSAWRVVAPALRHRCCPPLQALVQ